MYHLSGFGLEIHCSSIVFQCSALTLVNQCIKAEYLLDLEAATSVIAFSSSDHLISNSPYTIGCNHEVNGLNHSLSFSFESNLRFYDQLSLLVKVMC